MPAGFSTSDAGQLVSNERDVQARLVEEGLDVTVDVTSLAAVSNIFRAATMVRNHMERSVLAGADLSFTAFTVMWVLWIWGEQEARHVADEAGISRGTLTGVVTTLEARRLVRRRPHPDDRRSVLVSLLPRGSALIASLYPAFNREESWLVSELSGHEREALADALRAILRRVEQASG